MIQLKKSLLFLSLVLISLFLFGCNRGTSSSNDLIYDSERIDEISVGVAQGAGGGSVGFSIKDKGQIAIMVGLLKNIEVKELSLKQEKEIFKNAKAWSQNVKYQISLVSTKEVNNDAPSDSFKGVITILSDGNILFSDPKTLTSKDGKVKRTISYLSTKKQSETISQIEKIVEKNKDIQ